MLIKSDRVSVLEHSCREDPVVARVSVDVFTEKSLFFLDKTIDFLVWTVRVRSILYIDKSYQLSV